MMTDTKTDATATGTISLPQPPKTATITLTANGSTMAIVAERKGDGAKTYVITTGADKKSARGLTEHHATFEAAKSATEKMATKAEKLGWKRREARRGFVAKADAFTAIPAPPPPPAPKAKK